jgi:hypothetical protein
MSELPGIQRSITIVESIYEEYLGLAGEGISMSSLTALNRSYPKHLLIACASSLEDQVKQFLERLYRDGGGLALSEFVRSNVLERGYHGLFDWNNKKAQKFFSSFGEEVAERFKSELKGDDQLKLEHDAFMAIGSERNRLVHRDYASYLLSSTPEEVMDKYRLAVKFIQRFDLVIVQREVPESVA